MEHQTIKVKHILAALGISLIICVGVTLLFWLAEKKSIADSQLITGRLTPNQVERTVGI